MYGLIPRRVGVWLAWIPMVLCVGLAGRANAQTPSVVDTFRVEFYKHALNPEEPFFIDVNVANVDTLGAVVFRFRYDPDLIEPLRDTSINGNDTTISGVIGGPMTVSFEQIQAGFPEPGVMTFLGLDVDRDTSELYLPGSRRAIYIGCQVPQTAITEQYASFVFETDPQFPTSHNTLSDLTGTIFKRPTLVNDSAYITLCHCDIGDINLNGISHEIGDAVRLYNIMFFNGDSPDELTPNCPASEGDINCDGHVDITDLLGLIYVITGDIPLTVCNPCQP